MREKTEKQLARQVQHWAKVMGLSEWNIEVQFRRLDNDYGNVDVNQQYLEATIAFDLDAIDRSRFSFDEVATHELAHILVSPLGSFIESLPIDATMQRLAADAEDLVVTRMSRIVLNAEK